MTLIARLTAALDSPPGPLRGDWDFESGVDRAETLTPAAVLIPVIDRPEPTVLLTRRTDTMRRHAGQIAFPGGRADPEDSGPVATALREAEEEVALPPVRVRVIGISDTYETGTGYSITPVVGIVPPDLPLVPHEIEGRGIVRGAAGAPSRSGQSSSARGRLPRQAPALFRDPVRRARDLGRDRRNHRQPRAAGRGVSMLASQDWLSTDGARAVFAALDTAGSSSRLVGGAVRDALLGLEVSDIDIATRLSPEETSARLAAAGIKVVPTGIAHGTVTAVTPDGVFEVTTLRRDVATDGRHAVVAYTDDWAEDAARRDFTINALYANPLTGEVFDEVGGLDDLAARRVRFIGDPLKRIAEDHLRILRFFRFHARFGAGSPEVEGVAACSARSRDLMALSRERIRDELLKLLCVADPVPTIAVMVERGILSPVLPEAANVGALAQLVAVEHGLNLPCVALRRLAALMPGDEVLLEGLGTRLRLSNAERKRLTAMAGPPADVPADLRPLAFETSVETAIDRAALAAAAPNDIAAPLRTLDGWTPPRLPVSGRDLITLGVPQGPAVSKALQQLTKLWVSQGFPADRQTVLDLAQGSVVPIR